MYYLSLQNGSDIRGIALDGVEGQTVNLTETACRNIASAFGCWLSQKSGKPCTGLRVGIGRDSRLSGPDIVRWVSEQLCTLGIDVFDCAMASTPAMFMSTVTKGFTYDGAIMVTASHLPFNRNGLKFFTPRGGLEKTDITEMLNLAERGHFPVASQPGSITAVDFISVYAAHLAQIIKKAVRADDFDHPLAGFHIVVDAGNGAGGFYVDQVLQPLGANTAGSQFLDPDGRFPNHMPNPEDAEAMRALRCAVAQQKADLGVIFDTDVDRAGAVDAQGKEINRNRLIAMIAAIALEEYPGTTIVTDSITSSGLKRFIESRGGIHHRFKRGYKNVINEAIRLCGASQDTQVAIETSGHGALKENYFLDDGAYLVTKLIIKMAQMRKSGKQLGSLIDTLEEPAESVEVRMDLQKDRFRQYGESILAELAEHAEQSGWDIAPDNHEGLRVGFSKDEGDGWFLLRMSLHDPLMPLNIESDSSGGCRVIAGKLYEFLSRYTTLDSGKLKSFVQN